MGVRCDVSLCTRLPHPTRELFCGLCALRSPRGGWFFARMLSLGEPPRRKLQFARATPLGSGGPGRGPAEGNFRTPVPPSPEVTAAPVAAAPAPHVPSRGAPL